jgi:hypothetical protein
MEVSGDNARNHTEIKCKKISPKNGAITFQHSGGLGISVLHGVSFDKANM